MARFIFSMQNLLNIKAQLENQAKMEYANAQAALRRQEDLLEEYKQQKEDCFARGRAMRQTTLDMLELKENDMDLERLDGVILRQMDRVAAARDEVEDARDHLRLAMQERKTMEILREKAFVEFLEEEKHRESKEIDELVSYTYGMRIKENEDGGDV